MMSKLTKQQTIERLCALTDKVNEHFNYQHQMDCFCGLNKLHQIHEYRNDGFVLDFIEEAVKEKLTQYGSTRQG